MKTHLTAWGGALALSLTLGLAGHPAQTKWNLPGAYSADNYHSENLVFFGKEVEKNTGGKLQVTVHPARRCSRRPRSSAPSPRARHSLARC